MDNDFYDITALNETRAKKKLEYDFNDDETLEVDKILAEEIKMFHGHDEIKYELGSEFDEREFEFLEGNSEVIDKQLDEVLAGVVGDDGQLLKEYKNQAC